MDTEPVDALAFATAIVKHWEGFSLTPYHGKADRPDVWTIGWGSITIDGAPVTASTPAITEAKAIAMLQGEIQPTNAAVQAMVTVDLAPHQEAALTSFAYNEGITALRNSTLMRDFNAGNTDAAAAQFMQWVISDGQRVNGLIRRRGAEQAIFRGLIPFDDNLDAAMDQYGDAALTGQA